MLTVIPADVKQQIREAVASGDFRPIEVGGPHTAREWLAMIEYEAQFQEDQVSSSETKQEKAERREYAATLRNLAAKVRGEGFKPIKFHWEAPSTQNASRVRKD